MISIYTIVAKVEISSFKGATAVRSRPKSHTFTLNLGLFAAQPRWRQKPWVYLSNHMIFPVKFGINMHLQLALALRAWALVKNFTCNYLFQIALEIIRFPILRSICLQMVLRYKLHDTLHIVTNSTASPVTGFS